MSARGGGFRFDPPPVAFSPELRWVLVRAMGPVGGPVPAGLDGAAALALADRLDLTHRIGARQPPALLHRELGPRLAGRIFARHEAVRRWARGLAELSARVVAKATELGVPAAALKFLALRQEGVAPDGLRRAGDLDILVPAEAAKRLTEGLRHAGLREMGFPAEEHALALADADGRGVEIHWHVPGVGADPATQPVTYESLSRAGVLQPHPSSGFWQPRRHFTAAHLAVHGLVQHGWSPQSYPLFRVVCDLADLGVEPGGSLVEDARPWTAGALAGGELEALVGLAARLRSTDSSSLFEPSEEPDHLLLRHFVAGALDGDYQKSLRLRSFEAAARSGGLGRELLRAAWPTNAQLDLLYGPAPHPASRLLRRLRRPFDLVARTLRYARAALRHRRRDPRGREGER
jgi:hypothetical protein